MKKKYYLDLIDRIYNVLYLFENSQESYPKYLESIIEEISGNDEYSEFRVIRFRLNYLTMYPVCHRDVKRAVFKSIKIIDKIINDWSE